MCTGWLHCTTEVWGYEMAGILTLGALVSRTAHIKCSYCISRNVLHVVLPPKCSISCVEFLWPLLTCIVHSSEDIQLQVTLECSTACTQYFSFWDKPRFWAVHQQWTLCPVIYGQQQVPRSTVSFHTPTRLQQTLRINIPSKTSSKMWKPMWWYLVLPWV